MIRVWRMKGSCGVIDNTGLNGLVGCVKILLVLLDYFSSDLHNQPQSYWVDYLAAVVNLTFDIKAVVDFDKAKNRRSQSQRLFSFPFPIPSFFQQRIIWPDSDQDWQTVEISVGLLSIDFWQLGKRGRIWKRKLFGERREKEKWRKNRRKDKE